jgi:hypothetical protein
MNYPIDYTEDDIKNYDNFRKMKLVEYGNNAKDYELLIINIACKNYVSNSKGEEYILTDEEQEQMTNIWKIYGEPNINYVNN